MKKLGKVISELTPEDYSAIEARLQQNNAEKFLALLRAYHNGSGPESIMPELGISSGALYVMKSRLYDRIQTHLSGNIFLSSDEVLLKLHEIPDICSRQPRGIAVAFLLKLEEELLHLDMHNELVLVYSALKKMNLFNDSYFQYSQAYNRHIAYNLSIEKSEEIQGSFVRLLRQYDFSRDQQHLDKLLFLKNEIAQHYALHQSRQIRIIRNLMDAQVSLFCQAAAQAPVVDELLEQCCTLIAELPESSPLRRWMPAVIYLRFEDAIRRELYHAASEYYNRLLESREHLMLSSNVLACSFFPVSEQVFCRVMGKDLPDPASLKSDPADTHAQVQTRYAAALRHLFGGNFREASRELNHILNEHALRAEFHVTLEIRLLLIYLNIRLKDFDLAANQLRNISRKVKSDHPGYRNVLHLFNAFTMLIRNKGAKSEETAEQFILFDARNSGAIQVLRAVMPEIRKQYLT